MTSTTVATDTPTGTRTGAATVAAAALQQLETAWNTADGAAFGAAFAPDATFVTVRGDHIVGREAIGAGHAGIFATIYAGSVNRMELVDASEVAPGVVVGISTNTLDCPTGPLVGVHQARSTFVVVRGADGWQLAACHNTLVVA